MLSTWGWGILTSDPPSSADRRPEGGARRPADPEPPLPLVQRPARVPRRASRSWYRGRFGSRSIRAREAIAPGRLKGRHRQVHARPLIPATPLLLWTPCYPPTWARRRSRRRASVEVPLTAEHQLPPRSRARFRPTRRAAREGDVRELSRTTRPAASRRRGFYHDLLRFAREYDLFVDLGHRLLRPLARSVLPRALVPRVRHGEGAEPSSSTRSRSRYSMQGWRVGFAAGNRRRDRQSDEDQVEHGFRRVHGGPARGASRCSPARRTIATKAAALYRARRDAFLDGDRAARLRRWSAARARSTCGCRSRGGYATLAGVHARAARIRPASSWRRARASAQAGEGYVRDRAVRGPRRACARPGRG